MTEPLHNIDCDEWCNHCEICGRGILYGSRCLDHPLPPRPLARAEVTD